MQKRIVVATSTGCLDYYNHGLDIRIVRILLNLDGNVYTDGEGILPDTFYKYITTNKGVLPRTSQPSTGELIAFFEKLIDEGYEEVLVTTISSKLSGTHNGIFQVAEILKDRIKIIVFDTKTVCFNEGYFAIKAAEMINDNINTTDIIETLTKMRENNTIFFGINSLEYLVKNGRLSGAAGFLGKYLQIKPVLQVTNEGTIEAIEKVRTTKKSLDMVCDFVNKYKGDKKVFANILTTGMSNYQEYFIEKLKEKCGLENLLCINCSPVVGCHVGADVIGIGICIVE